ncbi:MAG TPA: PEP-CTERM sorting domain-containing protein [Bryobacteraceae bacterium]|nr:PEP-CTERM sorting domain-containing protein [Bryobacteraceae bacterium]
MAVVAGQWFFQGTTGVAYSSIEAFPVAALDPTAPVGTSAEYKPSDPAADDFFANLYLPYVDPANPPSATFEYFRYIPGSIDLKTTVATGETVRYSASYQFQDPAGGIANYTVSGVVGGGTGNTSFVLRDGLEVITGKVNGTFFETPEPAALFFVLSAVALLGWMSRRDRSARRH